MQGSSQFVSAEQGVACPLGGQVRFSVLLKANAGTQALAASFLKYFQGKLSDIQEVKHFKFNHLSCKHLGYLTLSVQTGCDLHLKERLNVSVFEILRS